MKKTYRIEKELWIINYIPHDDVDLYKMAVDNPNGCESTETLCEFDTKEEALKELNMMRSEIDVWKNYNQTRFTVISLSSVEYDDDGEIYDITGENTIAPFEKG